MSRAVRVSRSHPGLPTKIAVDALGRRFTYSDMTGMRQDGCEVIERVGAGIRGSRWRVRCSGCGAEFVQESSCLLRKKGRWVRFCCGNREYGPKLLGKVFDVLGADHPVSPVKVLDLLPGLNGATIARLRCVKCGARFRSHARWLGTQSHPRCPICGGGRSRQ